MYKICIRPILTYACPVWIGMSQSNVKRLQAVQNKCLEIIYDNGNPNFNHIKAKEWHVKAKIEFLHQYIKKLAMNFYMNHVKDIHMLKNFGGNVVDVFWDKRDWPHQKLFDNIDRLQ